MNAITNVTPILVSLKVKCLRHSEMRTVVSEPLLLTIFGHRFRARGGYRGMTGATSHNLPETKKYIKEYHTSGYTASQ